MFQKSSFTTIYTNYKLKLLVKSISAHKSCPSDQTSKSVPIAKENKIQIHAMKCVRA